MSKQAFHETVAQKLIEQMKQGTAPWQRPWEPGNANAMIPMNPTTGKRYKGINAIQLMAENHADQRWMTYKQATGVGGQVRKGEKGTTIQYWAFTEEKTKKDADGKPVVDAHGQSVKVAYRLERPRVFHATVFNAGQIDDLPTFVQKTPDWDPSVRAEQILLASNAVIGHNEWDRAFYRPSTDSIHLPAKHQFASVEKYYATALHELGHWTGHSSRLDRDLVHPFGSEGYAREELRAEIASMILGDELGIGHDPGQHTAYVASWIRVLENDPLELFRAAADAEKIQNFVLSFEQTQIQEQNLVEELVMQHNPHIILTGSQAPAPTLDNEISLLNSAQLQRKTSEQTTEPLEKGELRGAEKIWLELPFKQKDVAKQVAGTLPDGRKAIEWDKATSRWFAHPGADLEKLKPWLIPQTPDTKMDATDIGVQNPAVERTCLVVPYEQREAMKQMAGKLADGSRAVEWDKAEKYWFAHIGADLDRLKPWLLDNQSLRQEPALPPEQEFSDLLKSIGAVMTDEHPIMDGNTHRISIEGDKKGEKSGFYVGHLDGHPAGYVKNNRTGIEVTWKSKGYSVSPEQKSTLLAIAGMKREARQLEHAQMQAQAAVRLGKKLADLVPVTAPTPYLQKKGVEPQAGIFTDKDAQITCIPATDETGKLWSMQYIQADGTKRFAKNSRKEGCFHALGGLDALAAAPVIVIAEGYATAASVSEAIGFGTVAAFDAGNLESVARALHQAFPDKPIIIAGDDDHFLEIKQGINPGKTKAMHAALAVNGTAIFPIFASGEQVENSKQFTDFNDLAMNSVLGVDGVKRQVGSVVDKVLAAKQSMHRELQRQQKNRLENVVDISSCQILLSKGTRLKSLG